MSRPLACAAVAALMLAGCGTRGGPVHRHGVSGRPPAAGRVVGRLLLEGGPMRPCGRQPGPRPIRGVVTFTVAGHQPVTVRVGRSGVFSVGLPPGRYRVAGGSPMVSNGAKREAPCSLPLSVTVTPRHTARAAVICAVP